MVARIPYYFMVFGNINNTMSKACEEIMQLVNPEMIEQVGTSSLLLVIGFGLISIVFLIWYIALLYNGFKVASNAKGNTPIALFILSILLAEEIGRASCRQWEE